MHELQQLATAKKAKWCAQKVLDRTWEGVFFVCVGKGLSLKYNENTFLAKVACALQGCSEVAETAMIITRMIMTVTECIRFNWVDKWSQKLHFLKLPLEDCSNESVPVDSHNGQLYSIKQHVYSVYGQPLLHRNCKAGEKKSSQSYTDKAFS